MKKIVLVLGLVMALSLVSVASAATLAELQAQLATLQASIAAMGGSTASVSSAPVITKSLTIGSKGDEVTALQKYLEDQGLLVMPVGTDYGYFGSLTKAAVIKWQTANSVSPASGYFGPISRAALEALGAAGGGVVGTLPAGCTSATGFSPLNGASCAAAALPAGCTSAAGYSVTTGVKCNTAVAGVSGITTIGSEGTLTVTQSNAGLPSSYYEGDTKAAVLGLKIEAKNSDIAIQRVKVDLGNSTSIYNKILSRIYIMDGSTVLAESALNSSTVVKESDNEYTISLTGFSTVVAKGTSKVLTIAVDVNGSVDSTYRGVAKTIKLYGTEAVRGVDGAGLNQTSGGSGISRDIMISSALTDSATLKTSLSTNSPAAKTIVASGGSQKNEADKVVLLVMNVKAEKDKVTITDLTATTTGTGAALATTAYLYDGDTEVDNTNINSSTGVAVFSNLSVDVAKDTTKVLTLKVDVRNATTAVKTLAMSVGVGADGIVAENSVGDSLGAAYITGSAQGETMSVQAAAATYTLVSANAITKSQIGDTSSSTFVSAYKIKVAADGSDVTVNATGAFAIGIYVNNVLVDTVDAIYDKPSTGVTGSGPYVISDGNEATFEAKTSFVGPGGLYLPQGGIVTTRVESATSDLGTVTYISDTFRSPGPDVAL